MGDENIAALVRSRKAQQVELESAPPQRKMQRF